MKINNIQEFFNLYYNQSDIFYLGFKDRTNNKWYNKPFKLSNINYKKSKRSELL